MSLHDNGALTIGDTTRTTTERLKVTGNFKVVGTSSLLGSLTVGDLGTDATFVSGSNLNLNGNTFFGAAIGGGTQYVCVDNSGQVVFQATSCI